MYTYNRDCFSRIDYVKNIVYVGNETCKECGSVKKTKNGRKYLYEYGVNGENNVSVWHYGLFCGIDCMKAYIGE